MRIKTNSRIEIGRLFSCLEYGEKIAHDCALRQAGLAADVKRQFFLRQAHQEQHHAKIFSRVVLCVTPRGAGPVPPGLKAYRLRLEHACRRSDLAETLVGQQVVLEGFGELVLSRMNRKFDQRGIGFKRVRKTLLAQERGHHAFGHRMLRDLLVCGQVRSERVSQLTSDYLALVDRMLEELQPVFDVVGADAVCYRQELRERVIVWSGV